MLPLACRGPPGSRVHLAAAMGSAVERESMSRFSMPRYGLGMNGDASTVRMATAEPSRVPSGPTLLAIALSELARGIRGLDVLRRSVDRAPPHLA
jgi:hypothetical protein